MSADLAERGEVDLEQHRNDHQPDQHRHRQVDLGDLRGADRLKDAGHDMAERDADDDAERDPEGQIAFESRHDFSSGRRDAAAVFVDNALAVLLHELALLRRQEIENRLGRPAQSHALGLTTIGRLIRIGCAIMASRIWSSVSFGSARPSSA